MDQVIDRIGEIEERWLSASFDDPSKLTWSLPEQIANRLVEGIINGSYSPGQRLQETAIAQQFSVSRGPVREALRILEREGLVVIQARRGASVTALSAQNVVDIFEVRALLLGLAARKIAEVGAKEAIAFVAAATSALKDVLDDPQRFLQLVYRVSMYVAETGGNELARTILFSLARQTLSLTRLALLVRDNRTAWVGNWSAMEAAIRRKRPAEAEVAMRKLVETVGASAMRVLEKQNRASRTGQARDG